MIDCGLRMIVLDVLMFVFGYWLFCGAVVWVLECTFNFCLVCVVGWSYELFWIWIATVGLFVWLFCFTVGLHLGVWVCLLKF